MTAGELAVVLAAVLCCIGFAALIVVLMRVQDAMRDLRDELRRVRDEAPLLMHELRASVDEASASMNQARDDLARFDRVLGSAEAISDAVSGGSRVVRSALSAPVIKTVALATGTAKGARRLRRREQKELKRGRTAS